MCKVKADKRERGAPRRGPYGGKTRSFATKLTDETMERIEKRASASNMSISQAAEAIIVRGLDAEDDFRRHFASPLRSFEASVVRSMPSHGQDVDLVAWSEAMKLLVDRLNKELEQSIVALQTELTPPGEQRGSGKRSSAPRRRILDLD
jgi:hypothetical protein